MSALAKIIERSLREPESWRYSNIETALQGIAARAKPALVMPGSEARYGLPSLFAEPAERHQIVFVNGVWRKDMSHLNGLSEDLVQGGPATGYRFHFGGQNCLVTMPIELMFVTDAAGLGPEYHSQIQFDIGANTRLTLIEHHLDSSETHPTAHTIETRMTLGPQAKLVHGKILHGQKNLAHLAQNSVNVAEGGFYSQFALIKGTPFVRHEVEVTLAGKMAQAELNGVMLLRGQEHADTFLRVRHASPYGSSSQHYKSLLTDRAHGVFQGAIEVAQDAQKTDAHQLSRALLLSDQAEMNAKPELEIFADDVKCSHGCTVGDIDPEALFYLRARGIGVDEARGLLLRAFIDEVINEIQVPQWRGYASDQAQKWLDK